MKTTKIILFFFALFLQAQVFASNVDFFNYDEEKIQNELKPLAELEQFIDQQNGVTDSQISSKMQSLNLSAAMMNTSNIVGINYHPLGIPPFIWGCCLGPIGMLVVFLTNEGSSHATIRSFYGCAISTILFGWGYWKNWYPWF
jgi:hypothetical protein